MRMNEEGLSQIAELIDEKQTSAESTLGVIDKRPELGDPLPSLDEFLSLVEDEKRETAASPSAYAVYHKYSKSC